jgi:hypothetical protein
MKYELTKKIKNPSFVFYLMIILQVETKNDFVLVVE